MPAFTTILMIGCGGIASHLAPSLGLSHRLVLMDGDNFEPDNASRQLMARFSTGNKAIELTTWLLLNGCTCPAMIPHYLSADDLAHVAEEQTAMRLDPSGQSSVGSHPLLETKFDLVVSCVDNHAARLMVLKLANLLGIPAILAGNEDKWGDAYLALPQYRCAKLWEWQDAEDSRMSKLSCSSQAAVDENPQLPLANALASAAVLTILNSLQHCRTLGNVLACVRIEPTHVDTTSLSKTTKANTDIPNPYHHEHTA